jgi:hypothetical protein
MKSDAQGAVDLTACPHWGQGGQYVLDPVTGQRTRVDVPEAPVEVTEANIDAVPLEVITLNKKEKPRA